MLLHGQLQLHTYSVYASRNILLGHALKEKQNRYDSLGAHNNVTRSFSTIAAWSTTAGRMCFALFLSSYLSRPDQICITSQGDAIADSD
jgi:hypothetical protein